MKPTRTIRIAAVGDVALGGEFLERARPPGAPLTFPFAEIDPILKRADLVLVNLEGPIGAEGPKRPGRTALLHNHPEVLGWLASLPNCVCTLANNHTLDYGVDGLRRTMALLDQHGIRHLGAGMDAKEASKPLRLHLNGIDLALVGYTTDEIHVGSVLATETEPGCNGLPDDATLRKEINTLAATSDGVIALLHWGHEFHHFPTPRQVDCAHLLAEAGARLVIGHHPHVQQGVQQIDRTLVCHSLGNLILPEMRAETGRVQFRKKITKQFAILDATVGAGAVNDWNVMGGRCARDFRLHSYAGPERKQFETLLTDLSAPLGRPGYAGFWAEYRDERVRSLKRESVREILPKLAQSDFKTLVRTFSPADLGRLTRRVTSLLTRKRSGHLRGGSIR